MTDLDTAFVRSQFPAFSEPSLDGWAFFENAGGSYTCGQVIDRLTRFYRQTKVQPYYPFPASKSAGEAMDQTYVRLAGYLNVGEDEVHLGPSTSQNTYVLARALRGLWQDGDRIVVSNQDHEANAGVWRQLESTGLEVVEWRIDPASGRLSLSNLEALLTPRTRMVAFPHCSNVIAHINPVSEIATLASTVDAISVVDGVSFAPHGLPDVAALGADIYLFSLYKTWGPHLGLMTVKRPLLDRMSNQSHFFNADSVRKKLVPAGPDHAQIAAAGGIADYLDAVYEHHFDQEPDPAARGRRLARLFARHERSLLAPLLAWLRQRDDVRILGPDQPEERAPTVSLVPLGKPLQKVIATLTDHRVMAGVGDFYGVRPLESMGVPSDPGALRLSFVHYTTKDEIDQLLEALAAALDGP